MPLLHALAIGMIPPMITIIIHDRGKPWDLSLPSLRQKLRCPSAVSDLADFAVNVRGFVAVSHRARETIELRLRPSIVKPLAMAKAVEFLGERDGVRVVVTSCEDVGRFLSSRDRSIEHLLARLTEARSTRKGDFLARRHALQSAAADPDFGRILRAWRASRSGKCRGSMDPGLMGVVRAASGGRYLEVVPDHASGRLVIGAIGDGYSLYGHGWKSVAVGGRFEDMPDFEYARWAAQGYRDASRVRAPIVEDIAAVVNLPPLGWILLAYRRVILPLGGNDRPALLLGATLGQKVTRLGLQARNELGDVLQ